MGDLRNEVTEHAELTGKPGEDLHDLLGEDGHDDHDDAGDDREHENEPDERSDASGDATVLERVHDRRRDERDERAHRQKLDDRREHTEDVEQCYADDDQADDGPDAKRRGSRVRAAADGSLGIAHSAAISPSGSILS